MFPPAERTTTTAPEPAAWAAVVHVIASWVALTVTPVAAVPATVTDVTFWKPNPPIVMAVPPAAGPDSGLTDWTTPVNAMFLATGRHTRAETASNTQQFGWPLIWGISVPGVVNVVHTHDPVSCFTEWVTDYEQ
jgi:hypothetical protein